MSEPNKIATGTDGPGNWIADAGCGLAVAAVVVSIAVAVCVRIIHWGLSS